MAEEEINQKLLQKLIGQRAQIKGNLTRFKTYLDTKFAVSPDITELLKRLQKIELQWDEFNACQSEIELVLEGDVRQATHREAFEDDYFAIVSYAQKLIDKDKQKTQLNIAQGSSVAVPSAAIASTSVVSQQVNLPLLNLPRFKGAYNEYTHFRDTFESLINKNAVLSNIQKFHYLISCLDGDALKVVQSLEITDVNYQIALDLLKERYENKRVLINSHLKSLYELPIIHKESATALRNFLDSYNKDIRSLKCLGEPVESWHTILLYLLTSKLDFGSKREWESKIKANTLPTLEDFSKFLNARCQLLETLYTRSADSTGDQSKKDAYYAQKTRESRSLIHVSTNKPRTCFYCKQEHGIYYCNDFLKLTSQQRYGEVKKLNLCTNCLRPYSLNHICTGNCKICKSNKHNTLLHTNRRTTSDSTFINESRSQLRVNTEQGSQTSQDVAQRENINNININAHCNDIKNSLIMLGTASIYVQDNNHQWVKCRCLLDGGSQSNFITADLVKVLQLKGTNLNFHITGISEAITNISQRVNARVKSIHSNYSRELSFLVLESITGHVPGQSFDATQMNIPEGIMLADSEFNISRKVDMLLGASIFYELLSMGQVNLGKGQPLLQNSKLGWLVTGPLQINQMQNAQCLLSLTDKGIQSQLEKFWQLEDMPRSTKYTKNEQFCEDHFVRNHTRDETGRFTVSLPLKENYKDIGDTLITAEKRFFILEQKLQGNKDFSELYSNFMREYQKLGHMSILNDSEINTNDVVYYLPHHGVYKASSTTTKLRVVYDASAKSSTNISLNDVFYIGPTIQEDLFSILIRFRKHNYVLKGDITKMYRQVNIKPEQRNLQRILWRENPDQKLSHFVLNTVTYGTAPASFLVIRSLHQTAIDLKDKFPKTCDVILSDFYVDDLITGDSTIEGLQRLKSEIYDVLKSGGFILTQWMSNSKHVLDSNAQQEYFHVSDDKTVKTLGILWNPNLDTFQFTVNLKFNSHKLTKRVILSIISQVFDPLGIIGPVVIKAKLILQQLWKLKVGWDETIPLSHHSQFLQFFHELSNISEISVPRCVILSTYIQIQVHGFTDASEIAYGVCIYLRSIDSYGKVYTQLLCSKSRVAPLKTISLPRLELCGAVLLAQLTEKVITALKLSVNDIFMWTDSTIVLTWLSQESSHWKTFISNRVSEIHSLTNTAQWRHVNSNQNPADIISRGCNPIQLINCEIWWSGPHWLQHGIERWPDQTVHGNLDVQSAPEKRRPLHTVCVSTEIDLKIFDKFSNLNRLLNVTAWCLRFIKNLLSRKQSKERVIGNLTVNEVECAMTTLVRIVQKHEFQREISSLKNSEQVSKNSKLVSLNPFLDSQGVLRVGGRLKNAKLDYDQKFPILLPGKHSFTRLIILNEHKRTLHGGVQTVLSSLRLQFWPLNAKYDIKKIIRQCIVCFKVKPKVFIPMMGQLPESRVTPTRPFLTCGIDYAGPFMLKEGTLRTKKFVKAYVCVFICFSTKAIHLELAGDLSTPVFINALKRFFARRGISRDIWSDNGSNFVGAANEFKRTLSQLHNDPVVQQYFLNNHITWHFIPPRAPHFGGLWESAVKLTKGHLSRVIGISHLHFEDFYTVLTQIESILNSRPLCPLSSDPNDLDPLTPGHFLIGSKLIALPEENVENIPSNRLSKYQQIQHITQTFWRRWSREYLHNLQQRHKWMLNDSNVFKTGVMVLLCEDNIIPLNWKLGRVIDIHPGKDNITRVVSVKTAHGVVKRAVSKVCVLPIEV